MRRTILSGLALAVLTAGWAAAPSLLVAGQPTDQEPATEAVTLAWPPPPLEPRIRYVDDIYYFGEIQGFKKQKKLSLFEKLAGVKMKPVVENVLGRPYGIAVDSRDRIFVADAKRRSLVMFDPPNKKVEEWGKHGRGILAEPFGVATDDQDRVYVSDLSKKVIVVYDNQGDLVIEFGFGELNRPAGLALDRRRNILYVADPGAKQVVAFSLKNYSLVRRIGDTEEGGPSGAQLYSPANVAVDRRGFVYVTDQLIRKLFIFTRRGRLAKTIGDYGTNVGQFAFPKGVGVDSEGHIYVADAWFNNFQIFDQGGQVLLYVGERGTQPGQFTLAAGLYVDHKDRIYVTDFTGRVQVFQYIPQPKSKATQGGDSD